MAGQNPKLRAPHLIISLAIGLALAALVGVGVRTAYPAPRVSEVEMQKLTDQQTALDRARAVAGGMSASHQAIYKRVEGEIAAQKRALTAGRTTWTLVSGFILVVFGALFMGGSLLRSLRPLALSDGLLLGGLVTLLYAGASSLLQGGSNVRYTVPAVALAAIGAMGYLKSVRSRAAEDGGRNTGDSMPPAA